MKASVVLLLILIGATLATPAAACTAVCLVDSTDVRVGRNLDWEMRDGLMVVHPRDPARDVVYLSISFNQLGIALPLGGMNEMGLIVEELSYAPARTPDPGDRPTVDEFTFIQYLLDRCATVDEALLALDGIAVVRRWMGLHYFLADRTGDCAVLEFLDGRSVIHHGPDLPAPVLANDTYARSRRYLRRHVGFGGERRETDGPESPERFVRAARACAAGGPATTAAAFAILADVRQDDTRWSIVYDPRRLAIEVEVAGDDGDRLVDLRDWVRRAPTRPFVHDLSETIVPDAAGEWTPWTKAIEERLRARVAATLGTDPAGEHEAGASTADLPRAAASRLDLLHVQNAGVQVAAAGRIVLVDALHDLNVAEGLPPRLHDHLPPALLDDLVHGRAPFTAADAVVVTHGHDDHFDAGIVRRYLDACRPLAIVHPAGMAEPAAPGTCGRAVTRERCTDGAGPVRFTSLPLRHKGDDGARAGVPHLGFCLHLGPWNVIHLGDAGPSPDNLAALDALDVPGRGLLLAPYWFLTDETGLAWLERQTLARDVLLVHANRGNVEALAERLRARPAGRVRILLAAQRLQRFAFTAPSP